MLEKGTTLGRVGTERVGGSRRKKKTGNGLFEHHHEFVIPVLLDNLHQLMIVGCAKILLDRKEAKIKRRWPKILLCIGWNERMR